MKADFNGKALTASAPDVPQPNKSCGVAGCGEETEVLVLIVTIGGKEKGGRFSDFGYVDRSGEKRLRDGISFKSWVTRCGECYCCDLIKNG